VKLTKPVQQAVGMVDGWQGTHPAVNMLADDQMSLKLPRKGLCIEDIDRPGRTKR